MSTPRQVRRFFALLTLGVALVVPSQLAFAHPGQPPQPHDIWQAWNLTPSLTLPLIATSGLYAIGLSTLRHRYGLSRSLRWRTGAFVGGLLAVIVALVSPVDALGSALFSGHMAQHMLLILVAAPLLAVSAPVGPMLLALSPRWRTALGRVWKYQPALRAAWRRLSGPFLVWGLHAAALWLWHIPAAYQLTLRSEPVHWLQHFSFLGTALLFWWVVIHPHGRHAFTRGPGGALYVFTMALQSGLLGALLTFSTQPWYPDYVPTTPPWGLTPLEDQQLAGVIMWIPAGFVYVIAALAVMGTWLYGLERAEEHRS